MRGLTKASIHTKWLQSSLLQHEIDLTKAVVTKLVELGLAITLLCKYQKLKSTAQNSNGANAGTLRDRWWRATYYRRLHIATVRPSGCYGR